MRRPRAPLLVLLLATLCAACESTPTEPQALTAGTYILRTVNANALPFTILNNSVERVEIVRGSITLRANGTFTDEMHYRVTPVGGQPVPEADIINGTFAHYDGGRVQFIPTGPVGIIYEASVTAKFGLSQRINRNTLIYEK
jgi:hypothetical protein